MTDDRIAGPQGTLHVTEAGQGGLPVLFVHSSAGNTTHWAAQLDHLRATRRVVAFDLRGHGQSDPPRDADYSIEGMMQDVGAVADALDLTQFVLVGHSMGGIIALAYAAGHAERVKGLLLVDPGNDARHLPQEQKAAIVQGMESNYQEGIEAYWLTMTGPNESVRDRLLADLRATPREAVIGGIKGLFAFDPVPALQAYWGQALEVFTPQSESPSSLHRLHPALPHRAIEGASHWLQLDRPDLFNTILDGFLSTIPTPTDASG